MAFTEEEVDKRLLIGDAQTDTNLLLSLQREMQAMKLKVDVHQSQMQLMNAQISQLQQENNAQKLQGPSHNEVQILTGKMFYFV